MPSIEHQAVMLEKLIQMIAVATMSDASVIGISQRQEEGLDIETKQGAFRIKVIPLAARLA